ncbi:MAG: N-acetylmuramoyl-L-alanine amidase [Armatimonadetes bacterium]|nr:N-acetylmuramoyl-L-alanine amidase [Armatimonadota bacterium]
MNRAGLSGIALIALVLILPYLAGARDLEFEKSIIEKFLPYQKWEKEYRAYFQRHYHDDSLELAPKAIVMHYTASATMTSAYNTFRNGAPYDDGDVGVVFGHLSSHFIIDNDGKIYQILPLSRKCRGAYGVNHVAISIEMAALNEASLLKNRKLINSSHELVRYLAEKYNIPGDKVYGHYQVAKGRKVVPEYTDYGDRRSPDCYPASFGRSDPGERYMTGLWEYLKKNTHNGKR